MEFAFDIPDYKTQSGLVRLWEDGFEITVSTSNNLVHICANREGLVSLAKQLLALSHEGVPSGYHVHFDEYNSLERGSSELIIEKV